MNSINMTAAIDQLKKFSDDPQITVLLELSNTLCEQSNTEGISDDKIERLKKAAFAILKTESKEKLDNVNTILKNKPKGELFYQAVHQFLLALAARSPLNSKNSASKDGVFLSTGHQLDANSLAKLCKNNVMKNPFTDMQLSLRDEIHVRTSYLKLAKNQLFRKMLPVAACALLVVAACLFVCPPTLLITTMTAGAIAAWFFCTIGVATAIGIIGANVVDATDRLCDAQTLHEDIAAEKNKLKSLHETLSASHKGIAKIKKAVSTSTSQQTSQSIFGKGHNAAQTANSSENYIQRFTDFMYFAP